MVGLRGCRALRLVDLNASDVAPHPPRSPPQPFHRRLEFLDGGLLKKLQIQIYRTVLLQFIQSLGVLVLAFAQLLFTKIAQNLTN